jgi:hypothetical protein
MIAQIDARVAEGKAVIFLTYHCTCTNARDPIGTLDASV